MDSGPDLNSQSEGSFQINKLSARLAAHLLCPLEVDRCLLQSPPCRPPKLPDDAVFMCTEQAAEPS